MPIPATNAAVLITKCEIDGNWKIGQIQLDWGHVGNCLLMFQSVTDIKHNEQD